MKRSITYRGIALALGVLITVVIAVTLWMPRPATEIFRHANPVYDLSSTAKTFVIKVATQFFEERPL